MKRIIVFTLFLAMALTAGAQSDASTWSLIPKIGIDLFKTSSDGFLTTLDDVRTSTKSKTELGSGFTGGLELEYQATSTVSVSGALMYAKLSERFKDLSVMNTETTGDVYSNHTLSLDYIQLPVTANVYVAHNLAVKAGIQLAYLVNTNREYDQTQFSIDEEGDIVNADSKSHKVDIDGVCNKFNAAAIIGVSYEYMNVVVDARYTYGLNSTYKSWYGSSHNHALVFTAGYKFDL